jgi:hypothetical protein
MPSERAPNQLLPKQGRFGARGFIEDGDVDLKACAK